jgi:hypothetical protein
VTTPVGRTLLTASVLTIAAATRAIAQDVSVAQAINNRGQIAGGSLLDDQAAFHAFVVETLVGSQALRGTRQPRRWHQRTWRCVGQSDTGVAGSNGDPISLAFIADRDGVRGLR